MNDWMIYGAYGYSGRLITEEALRRGLRPILAGRSAKKLQDFAAPTELPTRAFPLDSAEKLDRALEGVRAVLNCAGPFSQTSAPFRDAVLRRGIAYLDITGEIPVLEDLLGRDEPARKSGAILLPGVGFDVVPTDCLALFLARSLPGAQSLELAFSGGATVSRGTLKTMIEGFPKGGCIRREGDLVPLPLFSLTRKVRFHAGEQTVVAIPWGDVASAYHSTGIPNIVVYTRAPSGLGLFKVLRRPLMAALRSPRIQQWAKAWVERNVSGPDSHARETGRMALWGRVADENGRAREAWLEVPEGYRFTALAAVRCVEAVLAGKVSPGAWTPAKALGEDFVLEIPGCRRMSPEPA